MKLVSDFSELYDCYFDGKGEEFRRMTNEGPSKREQFNILEELGFKVPHRNLYKEIRRTCPAPVVVYTDENAHCGEGKILVWKNTQEEFDKYKDCFCSLHIPGSKKGGSHSIRILNILSRQFLIQYKSEFDWRSNCGDGTIECIGETKKWLHLNKKLNRKLWAIDLVFDIDNNEWVAVDLNYSPGIKGVSGLSDYIQNWEIANLLGEKYKCQTQILDNMFPVKENSIAAYVIPCGKIPEDTIWGDEVKIPLYNNKEY